MIACYTGTRQDNRKENYFRLPFRELLRGGGQVSDFIAIKKTPLKHCQRHAHPTEVIRAGLRQKLQILLNKSNINVLYR